MTIEEIKNLSDSALGKRLVSEIDVRYFPNLCTNLDRIAEVERIVIEKVGAELYGEALSQCAGFEGASIRWGTGLECEEISIVATSSARIRAEACLLALTK